MAKREKDHAQESEKEAKSEATDEQTQQTPNQPKLHRQKQLVKRFWQWTISHKPISAPLAVVLLLAVLAAIPYSRYAIAGLMLKQTLPIFVIDAETGKPVSDATIMIGDSKVVTNNHGAANIRAKVGYATLEISKKYYKDLTSNALISISKPAPFYAKLQATGRAVPVTVLNKISKKPVNNVTIQAVDEDTKTKTGTDGKATLVVPADKQTVEVKLTGQGFNDLKAIIQVTSDELPSNTFEVTPSGKIYFLSNASGKIDLMKSDLDGNERQTVLPGTGKEDRTNTILLASSDWKYITLLSKRDGGQYAKLFLIDTSSDKVTTMDEGEATFTLYGWSDNQFIYLVNRAHVNSWEPKKEAIKSYNVSTKKLTTLTETAATGDAYYHANETIDAVYILGRELLYVSNWNKTTCCYEDKQATLNTMLIDGSQKKVVKTYSGNDWIQSRAAQFGEIYILYSESGKSRIDEYHGGKIDVTNKNTDDFYDESYPFYSVAPTGKRTLWNQDIDGKSNFFVGDADGENGKQIGRADDFRVYGWFTDGYVLFTKNDNELHIMSADDSTSGVENSLKITDYYKPNYNNRGFGYGYGG